LGIPAIIYERESAKGSHAEREEKGKGEGIARIVLGSLHGSLSRLPQSEAAVTVIPDILLLPPTWMHRVKGQPFLDKVSRERSHRSSSLKLTAPTELNIRIREGTREGPSRICDASPRFFFTSLTEILA